MTEIDINEHLSMDENSPYNIVFHTPLEIIEAFLTNRIKSIKQSENPRVIVLETWLLLDFVIRQLIIWGIGSASHSHDEFDLKSELLPIGFKNCLDFLLKFRDRQINLPTDPNQKCLNLPFGFWSYINKLENSSEKEIFLKILSDYQKTQNPDYEIPFSKKQQVDLLSTSLYSLKPTNVKSIVFRTVSDDWIKVTSLLTPKWFKDVEQINKARNAAAHSYTDDNIFHCFGINGDKKIEKLRKKCIENIELLLKINVK